jgi:hypothetical protein
MPTEQGREIATGVCGQITCPDSVFVVDAADGDDAMIGGFRAGLEKPSHRDTKRARLLRYRSGSAARRHSHLHDSPRRLPTETDRVARIFDFETGLQGAEGDFAALRRPSSHRIDPQGRHAVPGAVYNPILNATLRRLGFDPIVQAIGAPVAAGPGRGVGRAQFCGRHP